MRIPLVRFGSDDRPIEPWEERFAPIVIPIMLPLLVSFILVSSATGIFLFLGWTAISPVLPRKWRANWDTAFELDPGAAANCPECRSRLTLGEVDKREHVSRTEQGREFVMSTQSAVCPECSRGFTRFSLGKVWSSWSLTGTDTPMMLINAKAPE